MSKKKKKTNSGSYTMMPPQKLRAHPSNSRYFGQNNSRYTELFESIRANGFLPQYPVTCARESNNFVIICGHRRWKAACEQSIPEIPVILRHDLHTDSTEAEKIMIEDNLCRPLEGREFTNIERYMLAIQLDNIGTKIRGGDRRSEMFLNHEKGKEVSEQKNKNIAGMVGMSPRYLSMLSVICNTILKDLQQSSPDIHVTDSVYDQIKIAIDNNLSEDLSALARDEVPVYKMYKKYKKGHKPQTSQDDIQATEDQDEKDITFSNVVASLMMYFESQLDVEVFSEAAAMLLEPPAEQAKKLKLLSKAISNVIQKIKKKKTRSKKQEVAEPELFSSEEI